MARRQRPSPRSQIKLGESVIKDIELLSCDLFKDIPGARRDMKTLQRVLTDTGDRAAALPEVSQANSRRCLGLWQGMDGHDGFETRRAGTDRPASDAGL